MVIERFLLFYGYDHNPSEGWIDIGGDFDEAAAAVARGRELCSGARARDWWHVVDTTGTGTVIEEGSAN